MTSAQKGKDGEKIVESWLKFKGLSVSRSKYNSPYDLLVNGWRCEVKTASLNEEKGVWFFNIHRHGKINELEVDFYIFALQGVPYCEAQIYIIKKAPLEFSTFSASVRSLITQHSPDVMNVEPLLATPPPLIRAVV